MNWLMTRAPLFSSRFMWRTVWRFYIWLTCDCRRGGAWSSTGGRCDSCNRPTHPVDMLLAYPPATYCVICGGNAGHDSPEHEPASAE